MPYTALRRALDQLASRVWDDLTVVRAMRGPLRMGEVTVTERLHLDLLHSGNLAGVQYNVPHEPTTGADWEWFVQTPTTRGRASRFVHYRIQAKILSPIPAKKPPELRFEHINHGRGSQRARLLADAARIGAIPFYAFYVGDPWPASAPIELPPWQLHGAVPREHFGCTAVPALAVDAIARQAHGTPKAANQYLNPVPGPGPVPHWFTAPVWQGRRLSDLFLFSAPARAQGSPPPPPPTGPPGAQTSGPSVPLAERAKELTQDQAALLGQLREMRAAGDPPIVIHESSNDDRIPHVAAFFVL